MNDFPGVTVQNNNFLFFVDQLRLQSILCCLFVLDFLLATFFVLSLKKREIIQHKAVSSLPVPLAI